MTLVSELVYNLLDNAIKYNKDNGKITVFVGESAKGSGTVRKGYGYRNTARRYGKNI